MYLATYKLYIVHIILCVILARQSISQSQDEDIVTTLNKTLVTLDRVIAFFQQEVDKANLDAIYGIRVTEGILKWILNSKGKFLNEPSSRSTEIRRKLTKFLKQIVTLSNNAQVYIKKQNAFYYERFKFVVAKPWSYVVSFGHRKLPSSESYPKGDQNSSRIVHDWDEALSDQCMSEVIGSNPEHRECMLSKTCSVSLSDLYQTKYGVTHQVLFLTLALVKNCEEKYSRTFKKLVGMNVQELIANRCVKILKEMMELERQGIPAEDHDLYLEEVFVCSMQGYEEFFSISRLKVILNWQLYPGCFGNVSEGDMGTPGVQVDTRRARRDVRRSSMRRLLVDVELDYGCSSHESGLATATLGMYVKWLLYKLDAGASVPMTTTATMTINTTTARMNEQKNETHKEKSGPENERVQWIDYPLFMAVLVSILTTFLTITVLCILYKVFLYCVRTSREDNPYKKLNFSDKENDYVA